MGLCEVSAAEEVRDELRTLVQGYVEDGVSLLELNYQPHRKMSRVEL